MFTEIFEDRSGLEHLTYIKIFAIRCLVMSGTVSSIQAFEGPLVALEYFPCHESGNSMYARKSDFGDAG
jgi:hypothetical protein